MIDATKPAKEIKLPPIHEAVSGEFGFDKGVAGLDAIATQIEKDIDEYCLQAFSDERRKHLGASVVGHECERYIWFAFRWMFTAKFDGRMQRLFNRGHLEEARIISWLRGIGILVRDVEDNGQQFRIADVEGHFGGSCDGIGMLPIRYEVLADTQILYEFKTAGDKGFQEIRNLGVKKAKPEHWTQMCIYGRKLGLKYALYVCVNKNNDELNIELLELDWSKADAEINKAEKIIFATTPPPRISDNASFFKCRFCPANNICHLALLPDKNCRSCLNAAPTINGQWQCNLFNQIIPEDFIAKGCESWTPLAK
jgi:hypothetical protein